MRICIAGAGTRFLSGLSYYTIYLSNALADEHDVSVIPMRQLLPTRLYPGWRRVGAVEPQVKYDRRVRVFEGLDWYWLPSIIRAIAFLRRQRPEVLILQWWTGTVLHSYLVLAVIARLLGTRVVIEFHETLDPGELNNRFASLYVRCVAPLLMRMINGYVVHSSDDLAALQENYELDASHAQSVIPHGPYNHWGKSEASEPMRSAPDDCCNILFFGLIRPYKGVEDLVAAFDALDADRIQDFWLTVVGETWEGCAGPAERIANSPYRDRITFINRYVSDQEAGALFAGADAVALPYHRGSASGTLHSAMSYGLPVIVTDVGGLTEAVSGYSGARVIPPREHEALRAALQDLPRMRGQKFKDPHSWTHTTHRYGELFQELTTVPQRSVDKATVSG